MAKKSIDILKSYFETHDTPTESQFSDLIDSFFHKDGTINIENITGLQAELDKLDNLTIADIQGLQQALTDLANIEISDVNGLQTVLDGLQTSVNNIYTEISAQQTEINIINSSLDDKVDKEGTKQLSDENFTTGYKEILDAGVLTDAPNDGQLYGRQNQSWEVVVVGSVGLQNVLSTDNSTDLTAEFNIVGADYTIQTKINDTSTETAAVYSKFTDASGVQDGGLNFDRVQFQNVGADSVYSNSNLGYSNLFFSSNSDETERQVTFQIDKFDLTNISGSSVNTFNYPKKDTDNIIYELATLEDVNLQNVVNNNQTAVKGTSNLTLFDNSGVNLNSVSYMNDGMTGGSHSDSTVQQFPSSVTINVNTEDADKRAKIQADINGLTLRVDKGAFFTALSFQEPVYGDGANIQVPSLPTTRVYKLSVAEVFENGTTTDLDASGLNTLYPQAQKDDTVICESIITGAKQYLKTSTGWVSMDISTVI